jgi:hypothetical protein
MQFTYMGTSGQTSTFLLTCSFSGDHANVILARFLFSFSGYRDITIGTIGFFKTMGQILNRFFIDGGSPIRCDGRKGSQGSRALVFWADNLSPGTHTIKFEHTGDQGQYLNLDFFLVTQG